MNNIDQQHEEYAQNLRDRFEAGDDIDGDDAEWFAEYITRKLNSAINLSSLEYDFIMVYFSDLQLQWKASLDEAKEQEMYYRQMLLWLGGMPDTKTGKMELTLCDGRILVLERDPNYTLEKDQEKFAETMQMLHDTNPDWTNAIKWVPEVWEKNYKQLPPHALATINSIVTMKPGAGSVKVKE